MMNKAQLLEFIGRNYADDDVFGGVSFWTRSDVEQNEKREMTDEQFERFDLWMSKYADGSYDYDEAVRFAMQVVEADK